MSLGFQSAHNDGLEQAARTLSTPGNRTHSFEGGFAGLRSILVRLFYMRPHYARTFLCSHLRGRNLPVSQMRPKHLKAS